MKFPKHEFIFCNKLQKKPKIGLKLHFKVEHPSFLGIFLQKFAIFGTLPQ